MIIPNNGGRLASLDTRCVAECFLCPAPSSVVEAVVITSGSIFAVMDRFPLARGHVLIAPMAHNPDFFELPEDVLLQAMALTARIAKALKVVFETDRIGVFFAGKERPEHAHIHVLPLEAGLKSLFEDLSKRGRAEADLSDRRTVGQSIHAHLAVSPESQ